MPSYLFLVLNVLNIYIRENSLSIYFYPQESHHIYDPREPSEPKLAPSIYIIFISVLL